MNAAFKDQISDLIAHGDIEEALQLLSKHFRDQNQDHKLRNISLLTYRLREAEKQFKIQSIISASEYEQTRNKVILGIQDIMEDQDFSPLLTKRFPSIKLLLGVLVTLILVVTFYFRWNNSVHTNEVNKLSNSVQKDTTLSERMSGASKVLKRLPENGAKIPLKRNQDFDTVIIVLNTPKSIILIDGLPAEIVSGSTSQVKRIIVPKNAREISLQTRTQICKQLLKTLGQKIYQNQICN